MKPTAVINVVGLSSNLLGEHTPRLRAFAGQQGAWTINPVFPALTCSSQSTYLTGLPPSGHGVVGNGWYFHDLAQVWLWRQSNHLVHGEKIWETARKRDPKFTCANLFWWFNMYSSVDFAITPRPIYRADGLKLPDIYTEPADLREIQQQLGQFPLFKFWGPNSSIESSAWIAAAAEVVYERFRPTLNLVYLPHLDYVLQREGPAGPTVPEELRRIDDVCGRLVDFYRKQGVHVVVLSEYGINAVRSPIQINRVLRREGLLRVHDELGEDHFDAGGSPAFAVVDHQIAHVYVNDKSQLSRTRELLEATDGVEHVLDRDAQARWGIAHDRAGDLIAVAQQDRWFSYEFWLDDARAPDYAPTVDIHRKPGYDPAELFVDPNIRIPAVRVARRLAAKKLGFRYRMDVIPLNGNQVRGSHGRSQLPREYHPVLLSDRPDLLPPPGTPIDPLTVKDILLRHVYD
jgi:predicted AlkP superfamily pyrophosphatase or phosphodiesterase